MAFDDIPEDKQESFPCACGGEITLTESTGLYACDTCDFYAEAKQEKDDEK